MDVQPFKAPSENWANGLWFLSLTLGCYGVFYAFNRVRRRKDLRWSVPSIMAASIAVAFVSFYLIRDIEGQKKQVKLGNVENYRQFWNRYLGIPLGEFDTLRVTFNDGTEIVAREFQIPLEVIEASEVDNEEERYRIVRGHSRSNPTETIEFRFFPAFGWRERLPVAGDYVLCFFNTGGVLIQEGYLLGAEYHILMPKPAEK